jgi:signal transduction histidine kinase
VKSAGPAAFDMTDPELGWTCSAINVVVKILFGAEHHRDASVRDALDSFEHVLIPAAVLDAEKVHHANQAWRRAIGIEIPDWGRTALEVVLRTGATVHLPEVITQVGNRTRWLAATMIRAGTEQHTLAIVVWKERRDSAIARYLDVTSSAVVWSGAIDTPNIGDFCNKQARWYAGDTFISDWQQAVHPEDVTRWTSAFEQACKQRRAVAVELRLLRSDGEYRWHNVSLRVSRTTPRWFAAAVDCHQERLRELERGDLLDRLRQARIDAERAHQLKDHILAAVSHELRAPVTTLMLWERVLRDPVADPAARLQALDAIHQSASAQSRLVNDLLDVSRGISGKLYVDIRSVDIGRIVGEATEAALPAALAKRISLTNDQSAFDGEVAGDAARLRQVLDNLLSNAINATPPGGRVVVSLRRKGRVVLIRVEDTGCGIEPSKLETIFEPFSQGTDELARRHGGLGLGLAIARQIVDLHHGTITAFSQGPSRGARITLTLPIAGQPRAPTPPTRLAPPPALKSVRVLVVDDDERVRNALAFLLDRAGAIVDRADSAAAARRKLGQTSPDVVICDIAMPDEDGYTFIRSLRASGNKVPAIALSAYASSGHADEAVSAGFDLHVAKPVDFESLGASLARVLDLRREAAT